MHNAGVCLLDVGRVTLWRLGGCSVGGQSKMAGFQPCTLVQLAICTHIVDGAYYPPIIGVHIEEESGMGRGTVTAIGQPRFDRPLQC